MKQTIIVTILVFILLAHLSWAQIPQTISYQGILTDGSSIVIPDGTYNLTFSLYEADTGGAALWSETQSIVVVNGVFNVILGSVTSLSSVEFDQQYWLGITVGAGPEMTPRIKLAASPYSLNSRSVADGAVTEGKIAANAVTSGKIDGNAVTTVHIQNGTIAAEDVGFNYAGSTSPAGPATDLVSSGAVDTTDIADDAVIGNKIANSQVVRSINGKTDDVTLAAGTNIAITPSGSNLTISSSFDGWRLTGNAGTNPSTNFMGTTDDQALALRVNNLRVLRLEPSATSPNLIGGYNENGVTSGVYGATISGGGSSGFANSVTDACGTIGGGWNNQAGDGDAEPGDVPFATIGGGDSNFASERNATVGGGGSNNASGVYTTVAGGQENAASGPYATIGGGFSNSASGHAAIVSGGETNAASGGGSTISGGQNNVASMTWATVGGGYFNTATANFATIAGGGLSDPGDPNTGNRVTDNYGTIGGGGNNQTGDGDQNLANAIYATVSGGSQNTADGKFATIGGGFNSIATGEYSVIPGGSDNAAVGDYSFAAGRKAKANDNGCFVWGDSTNSDISSSVNDQFLVRATGGVQFHVGTGTFRLDPHAISSNVIAGYKDNSLLSGVYGATICGGGKYNDANYVTDIYGTIGGGIDNQAGDNTATLDSADYATVSGGTGNISSGSKSTVGGGAFNIASGLGATVPGGIGNMAKGDYSFAAGRGSEAKHNGCFVWSDTLLEDFSSTGDNQFLVRAIGGIEIESYGGSLRLEPNSTCMNVIGGNWRNSVTSDVYGATICGGGERDQKNTVTDHYGTIGGGRNNQAGDGDEDPEGATYATICGGLGNTASDEYATVSGGIDNTASKIYATVGGGRLNVASDNYATVAGGYDNVAEDNYATVGGGGVNNANGWYSTIPGGYDNETNGWYSLAAGRRAKANNDGCFVWGDSTDADISSSENDQFIVRASGGAWLYGPGLTVSDTGDAVLTLEADTDNTFENDNPGIEFIQDGGVVTGFLGYEEDTNRLSLQNRYTGNLSGVYIYSNADRTAGVYLSGGGSTWNTVSDRAMKDNIRPVDVKEVLSRLVHVPISKWSYKTQDSSIEHMGPMSQDFYAAFGLGEDDKHISTIDPDGVALAAIQGLYELVKEKDARIADLEARLAALEAITSSGSSDQTASDNTDPNDRLNEHCK